MADDVQILIPDEVKERFPDLVPQILASKTMDDEERNYWFSVLPIMTEEQIEELKDILKSEQELRKKEAEETKKSEGNEKERRIKAEKRQKLERQKKKQEEEEAADLLAELDGL